MFLSLIEFDSSFSVLVSLRKDLLLERIWLRETKSNLVGSQLMVAVHDGINLVFHSILVQWVEHNLLVFLSVKGNSSGFSGDMRWEADIIEDLKVDSSESS